MDNILEGEVELAFIMGGISKEKKKPYIQVSNGLESIFLRIDKDMHVDADTFSSFEEGDTITCVVQQRVGSTNVKLMSIK